jgi:putative intracellular protease/amidase
MQIAIVLFNRLTALDAIGPYEVLSRVPDAEVVFVAAQAGPLRTDNGRLGLLADAALDEVRAPEIVLVPGGPAVGSDDDSPIVAWLRAVDATTRWTTSVCTGSLLLAAAGLLNGRRATSHWLAYERLSALGATPVSERVVVDGKYMTGAGVSAGIDMGLTLAAAIAGDEVAQGIQLALEYDPRPPFGAGSPRTAPAAIVEARRAASRFTAAA